MPVKCETPLRALRMGCGESLVARVSLAMRYLGWVRAGGLAMRSRTKSDRGGR
jgi:hypothetical protein